MSIEHDLPVTRVNEIEYNKYKYIGESMEQKQLLDEYAHLSIRESELEKQITYLNACINDRQSKLQFITDMLDKEQLADIESKWHAKNRG